MHSSNSLDRSISYIRVSGQFSLLSCFVEISEHYANSVHPDQTPHSGASVLGLHCLPMSLLWDTTVGLNGLKLWQTVMTQIRNATFYAV